MKVAVIGTGLYSLTTDTTKDRGIVINKVFEPEPMIIKNIDDTIAINEVSKFDKPLTRAERRAEQRKLKKQKK